MYDRILQLLSEKTRHSEQPPIKLGGDPYAARKNAIRDRLRNPAGRAGAFERLGNIQRDLQLKAAAREKKAKQKVAGAVRSAAGGAAAGAIASKGLGVGSLSRRKGAPGSLV